MRMGREYLSRQIKISKAQYIRIKGYCVATEKQITLFFDEVLKWFIKYLANRKHVTYEACKYEDYVFSMRISKDLLETISDIASENKVSDARVISTALSLYLEHFPI